jgi:predicted Zn-dependent peptidase
MRPAAAAALLALACAPKVPPSPADAALAARPAPGPAPVYTPPVPVAYTLSNGLQVWLLEDHRLPLVDAVLLVPGGSALDPADEPGLTALSDALLLEGAGGKDASAFAEALESQALALESDTTGLWTTLSLAAPSERWDAGLDLLADAVLRPTFADADITRIREQMRMDAVQRADDPRALARLVGRRAWWGPGHPLAHPTTGTAAALEAVDPAAVRASWATRSSPQGSTLVVVGDIGRDALTASLEARFAGWVTPPPARPALPPPAGVSGGTRGIFVDNPGASQSVLLVQLPGPRLDQAPVPFDLAAVALGGTFTSRLNRLLREEKGYTYGARAALDSGPLVGVLEVFTAVRGDATAPALTDLLGELRKLPAGVDAAEVRKAQGARQTDAVESMETRGGAAWSLATLVMDGRPPGALADDLRAAAATDAAAASAAVAGVSLDQALIVVVGDLSQVRSAVESAVPATWSTEAP